MPLVHATITSIKYFSRAVSFKASISVVFHPAVQMQPTPGFTKLLHQILCVKLAIIGGTIYFNSYAKNVEE